MMKTKSKHVLYAVCFNVLLCSNALWAKNVSSKERIQEVPVNDAPVFHVDKDVADKIYKKSIVSEEESETSKTKFDVSMRIYIPDTFELDNRYFHVPYSDNTKTLTGFMAGAETLLISSGLIDGNVFARVGYVYNQGIYQVQSDSGLDVKDAVELQWIPTQFGVEMLSRALATNQILLSLFSSVGSDLYMQSGQLDGMNQTFWVPRYELGLSTTLFAKVKSSGFDGVRVSGVYYQSFASSQVNRGVAMDLGARYAF